MSRASRLGQAGEKAAQEYIKSKGYEILELNWIDDHLEVDIIAKKDNTIAFIEVKTATYNEKRYIPLFVDRSKQKFMIKAMKDYFQQHNIDKKIKPRFDIITCIFNPDKIKIQHIFPAFFYVPDKS